MEKKRREISRRGESSKGGKLQKIEVIGNEADTERGTKM